MMNDSAGNRRITYSSNTRGVMNDRKRKLIDLGSETLAEAFLSLSEFSSEADDFITQLIATPQEKEQRFRQKLSNLQRSGRLIRRQESYSFAKELKMLLRNLYAEVYDPLVGVKLVAVFYEAEEAIFGMCDDSIRDIADVFRINASMLFTNYASLCSDKQEVANIILKLNEADNYGVRDKLTYRAGGYLPEEAIRFMIDEIQKRADKEEEEDRKKYHLELIVALARQIKDGRIFERACIAAWGEPDTEAFIDIAHVYLGGGDAETAHSWLKKIPEEEAGSKHEQDMLEKIYRIQGDSENLTELLFQDFRSHPSTRTLQKLLDIIGHDKRDDVVNDEVRQILKTDRPSGFYAEFMIAVGKIDEAETYLLKWIDELTVGNYSATFYIAKGMESENRFLVASLVYRKLLGMVLERDSDHYTGIQSLERLDELSMVITDWKNFDSHEAFRKQIVEAHGHKRRFWSKYREGK